LSEVDFDAAAHEAIQNLSTAITEADAEVAGGPLPRISADHTQAVQLFQNLIANAIKFRGEKRPIVHIRAERRADEWLFSVSDNGIGIAPEHRARIFVIFQKLHPSEQYGGTGVGLAICKRIVERHSGKIWVES